MKEADRDQASLTESERERNKRSGDIYIFYRKGQGSALRRATSWIENSYQADFESKDEVAGIVSKVEQSHCSATQNVCCFGFTHPAYETHSTDILQGAIMPKREVEEFEIYQVERRFF